MADREKVVRAVETCFDSWIDKHRNMGLDLHEVERMKREALELLQAPEIVRCKDCVYATHIFEPGTLPYIKCCGVAREPDWFCADGKRREPYETDRR